MTTYHAVASRDTKYWLVHVPEIDKYTQARALAEVEPMARDLIALWLEIPEDSFDVVTQIKLPPLVQSLLDKAAEHRETAQEFNSLAASEYRQAASELKNRGLTVRDVGMALGVSHQRAQQLVV
ncbi:HicB family toxin-antitoxin system [Mycobacteroides abscessus]|uniref:HicB family toxin-antitoxin system n=1 Tax=Mycobacteroides abscessus TaxID=36809 RepID=UPI001F1F7914|nr:HicB family toxin-antitoxin system [Mycobacteroides abscessus]